MAPLASSLVLALASCASLALAAADGSGLADMKATSVALRAKAQQLPAGSYTITASDGTPLVASRDGNGQNYAPRGSGGASAIQLEPLDDGDSMRISMSNSKCLSAQWGGSYDWAAPLYACAVGSGYHVNGLVTAKQYWLFIPAGATSNVANLSGAQAKVAKVKPNGPTTTTTKSASTKAPSTKTAKSKTSSSSKPPSTKKPTAAPKACKKNPDWIGRHPEYVNGTKYQHGECASHLPTPTPKVTPVAHGHARRHSDRRLDARDAHLAERDAELAKRAGGQFYIVAVDHITDMQTRAFTNKVQMTGGDGEPPVGKTYSVALDLFDPTDKDQIFTITSA